MRARTPHPLVLAISLAAALTLSALPGGVRAQPEGGGNDSLQQTRPAASEQDRLRSGSKIYGSTLMKRQERTEHRNKLRSMTNNEERDAYLLEHRQKMQERAKERGMWLPGMPRPKGKASTTDPHSN